MSAIWVPALLAGAAWPAAAQVAPPRAAPSQEVVVQASRAKLSDWRVAETSHVILMSDGRESDLVRMATNLELLHWLLTGLMGRTGQEDVTTKLRITLIGDTAEFDAMDLRNLRWQQGPYSDLFRLSRYYDPRVDGAVMATTRVDQRTPIERTMQTPQQVLSYLSTLPAATGAPSAPGANAAVDQSIMTGALVGDFATADMRGEHDLSPTLGGNAIEVPADSLLYAGYAQHFLLTYFPQAYPRWYLDGFGQMFVSFTPKRGNVIEWGRSPKGAGAVLEAFGGYPLKDVLDGEYLTQKPHSTRWTPVHAWMLTHFLFFSDTRRPQLRQYLLARARGQSPTEAAAVFGDLDQFARELRKYYYSRKPFLDVRYPATADEEPVVRRLTEAEAAFVQGRLELGSRVQVPAPPAAGTPPDVVAAIDKQRASLVKARDRWLSGLRRDAAHYAGESGAQQLLAEAECRSGNTLLCADAADRALALAPGDSNALNWKGVAQTQAALAGSPAMRDAALAEARATLVRANRADTENVWPLIGYYRSFADAGQPAPDSAVDGLLKAVDTVPDSPASRLLLGDALAARGNDGLARATLLPVVDGPYTSPEQPAAAALLARLPAEAAQRPPSSGPAVR